MRCSSIVLALVAAAASAQPQRVLPVVVEPDGTVSSRALAAWGALAESTNTDDPRFVLVAAEALADAAQAERLSAEAQALAALDEARGALARGDRGVAGAAAARAASAFERSDWRREVAAQRQALALSGALQRVQAASALLATMDPDFQAPAFLLPDEQALLDLQREGKRKATRGEVTLESRPPAAVWIDGRFVGATPVTVPIIAGRHRVTLLSPTHGLHQVLELMTPGATSRFELAATARTSAVSLALAELGATVRRGAPSAGVLAQLAEAGAVVVVRLDTPSAAVLWLEPSMTAQAIVADEGTPRALRDAIRSARDQLDARPVTALLASPPDVPSLRGPVVAVTGFVGLASAIGLLVASQLVVDAAARLPQVEVTRYDSQLGTARILRVSSAVVGVLGAACSGLGAWWWVRDRAAAPGP